MKPSIRITKNDCWEALGVLAIILLALFVIPTAPEFVRVIWGSLVAVSVLWAAATALRERWRASHSALSFFSYYLRLIALGIAIILAFLLLVVILGNLFV